MADADFYNPKWFQKYFIKGINAIDSKTSKTGIKVGLVSHYNFLYSNFNEMSKINASHNH